MPRDDLYSLSEVLEREFYEVGLGDPAALIGIPSARSPDGSFIPDNEPARLRWLYRALSERRLAALCLSGGGIRSAAFSLGVVQGLANFGLLKNFDYLSTVSGGGYIGSWLSNWLHRNRQSGKGSETVLSELCMKRKNADEEPLPIRHLRQYSSYLTPKVGVFSADTWAAFAIVLRNMLLNWLILVPALCLPVFLVKIVAATAHTAMLGPPANLVALVGWISLLLIVLSVGYTQHRLYSVRAAKRSSEEPWNFLLWSLLSAVIAGAAMTWVTNTSAERDPITLVDVLFERHDGLVTEMLVLGASAYGITAVLVRGWAGAASPPDAPARKLETLFLDIAAWTIAGLVWGALVWLGMWLYSRAGLYRQDLVVMLGMPWLIVAMRLGQVVYIALRSYSPSGDFEREWLARAAGWHLVTSLSWTVLSTTVFVGSLLYQYEASLSSLVTVGALSGFVTRFLGKSSATPGGGATSAGRKGLVANIILAIAGPLFAAILLILLSVSFDALVCGRPFTEADIFVGGSFATEQWWKTLLVLGVLVATLFVSDYFINVNRFSLHAIYRNRLIRAFLGASPRQPPRKPDGFTGFDQNDNVAVARTWPGRGDDPDDWRPLHVINMALNLASTRNLAWQQRKATSFTVSPLFSGSAGAGFGYRKTALYGNPGDGISLGTAMAISGAAVSPNMGYHTSPSIAFLLTLFNVRLGWWLGNPGPAGAEGPWWQRQLLSQLHINAGPAFWRRLLRRLRPWLARRRQPFSLDAPRLSIRPLFAELFGLTDEGSRYVYLSDGGHFEDLGLYEMVRRRCKWIVVVDGDHDPDRNFGDLGNAVRKIWIDLGVQIDFSDAALLQAGKDAKPGEVPYYALGEVTYVSDDPLPDRGKAPKGHILYIKPFVRDDEAAADVIAYKRAHPDFPHQSTEDQWFDEPQLEAYRALGHLIIHRIVDAAAQLPGGRPPPLGQLLDQLRVIDPTLLRPKAGAISLG